MPIPSKEKREAPKTAKMRVYEELKKWIIDGTLQPGEKIYDLEIAQYFSVSRTPVREAIQLLVDQKLIEVFPGRESRVAEIGAADIDQFYKMLASLHSLALEFAYPKIDETIIAKLKQKNEKLSQAVKEKKPEKAIECDQAFHHIILKAADNDFLTAFSNTLEGHITRIENLYADKLPKREKSVHGHEKIIKALENNNLVTAKEAVSQNWLYVIDTLNKSSV